MYNVQCMFHMTFYTVSLQKWSVKLWYQNFGKLASSKLLPKYIQMYFSLCFLQFRFLCCSEKSIITSTCTGSCTAGGTAVWIGPAIKQRKFKLIILFSWYYALFLLCFAQIEHHWHGVFLCIMLLPHWMEFSYSCITCWICGLVKLSFSDT